MRSQGPLAHLGFALTASLAWSACGASTPLRTPSSDASLDTVDASPDVSHDVSPDVSPDVAPDVAPDVTPAVDTGPACVEGLPCTDGVDPCVIGRTRCGDNRTFCLPAGNQLPGTMCPGGTCDGRGSCRVGEQRSCPSVGETGCGVVFLTGGTFTLGDASGYRAQPTQPSITVGGFIFDASEVTVARFQRFWSAGHPAPTGDVVAYPNGPMRWTGAVNEPTAPTSTERCNWGNAARAYHPLNCVDWATAQAFCVWDGGRLPTEAEWEYAARYAPAAGLSSGRLYPWGSESPSPMCDRAQWSQCAGADGAATRAVNSFAGAAGMFDLAGNVWEWTADYFALYSDTQCWGRVARTNPRCAVNTTGYPTIRGGSWYSPERVLLQGSARDDAYRPDTRSALLGFRCARTR